MAKFKLNETVYFDGVPHPAGSVIDTDIVKMNGESIVQWGWAVPVSDDTPADPVPTVGSDPDADDDPKPTGETSNPDAKPKRPRK